MIQQFRSLNPVNLLFLAIIAFVLRAGMLLLLPEVIEFSLLEPFAGLKLSIPQDFFTPFSNFFYATLLTYLQAILLNRIINNYNLLGKPSFMPALMFVTVTALLPPFIILTPALIANFLIIWMIEKFLSIYRRESAMTVMYDLGMIVALGTLIYFPFISMLPLVWIALIVFRPFNWREWLVVLLGVLTVFYFVAVFYYLNDSLHELLTAKVPIVAGFPTHLHVVLYDYIVLIPLLFVLILSIFPLRQRFYRSNVHVRKSYVMILFLLVFSLLSFVMNPDYNIYHFLLSAAPVSILMACYFISATKRWFYESLYVLLAVVIIYFQFV